MLERKSLPKISWCTFVTVCAEIYPRTCKHSLPGEQAGLGGVSLFIDLHDFRHFFVFLRRDLTSLNRAECSGKPSSVIPSRHQ